MKMIVFFLLLLLIGLVVNVWVKDMFVDIVQIKCGEYFVIVVDCVVCYMVFGGKFFVGGLLMQILMLGIIYSSNIMFDEKIGIGKWMYEEFECVVCKGVDDDGNNLYLVMLYLLFVKINDVDMCDFYVYFCNGVIVVQNDLL